MTAVLKAVIRENNNECISYNEKYLNVYAYKKYTVFNNWYTKQTLQQKHSKFHRGLVLWTNNSHFKNTRCIHKSCIQQSSDIWIQNTVCKWRIYLMCFFTQSPLSKPYGTKKMMHKAWDKWKQFNRSTHYMNIAVFLDVTPHSLENICHYFRGTYCLHDQLSRFLCNICKSLCDHLHTVTYDSENLQYGICYVYCQQKRLDRVTEYWNDSIKSCLPYYGPRNRVNEIMKNLSYVMWLFLLGECWIFVCKYTFLRCPITHHTSQNLRFPQALQF